jgi:hypothetical protein
MQTSLITTTLVSQSKLNPGNVEVAIPASCTITTQIDSTGSETIPVTTTHAIRTDIGTGTVEILIPAVYVTMTIPPFHDVPPD